MDRSRGQAGADHWRHERDRARGARGALPGAARSLAIVARDEAKARAQRAKQIEDAGAGTARPSRCCSPTSRVQAQVRRLAAEALERYPRIDVLVNNAGAMFAQRRLTDDGVELTWALNHLAPFLLTTCS